MKPSYKHSATDWNMMWRITDMCSILAETVSYIKK